MAKKATEEKNVHAVALGRLGGLRRAEVLSDERMSEIGKGGGRLGGKARAAALTKEERSAIAKKAAVARWGKRSVASEIGSPDTAKMQP